MRRSTILIITDRAPLGHAIERLLRLSPLLAGRVEPCRMTYDEQARFLTPELVKGTDLFVLDLMRTYENGLRAEGLAAAKKLAQAAGKRSLVVSYYTLGREVQCPWYWDLGNTDSLDQRILRFLSGEDVGPAARLTEVEKLFPDLLDLPRQH